MAPGYKTFWPGEDGGHVMDVPLCGFDGEHCPAKDSNLLTIVLTVTFAVLILACVAICFIYVRIRRKRNNDQYDWWKIDPSELQPMTRNHTKSTFSFVLRQSKADMAEASTHDKNVSLYKGNVVKVEGLDQKGLYVTSQLLKELQQMRAINHPNLLRFIGLCLEADEKFMVTEHCPKGALAVFTFTVVSL
ncbi:atrial natriuretic peptide receptor 1-like [Physella acuta]|uniref:atrial natriuretic peptide receptor 1-like n=1 Tax=Physella acuta TaxID=109671 RepID=UPI0027DD726A|nr:atrial natriuretic peptide receptor 1-like [Physella acuta]